MAWNIIRMAGEAKACQEKEKPGGSRYRREKLRSGRLERGKEAAIPSTSAAISMTSPMRILMTPRNP